MRYLLFLAFFILQTSLSAQEVHSKMDILYFHDGGFIKGILIEKQGESYTFETFSGDQLTISKSSVSKVVTKNLENKILLEDGRAIQTKGFYATFNMGPQFGYDGYVMGGPSFQLIFGHQFNQYANLGGGIAFEYYGFGFVPLYLDFRGYPRQKRLSPFYALNVGYGFILPSNNDWDRERRKRNGGIMVNPSMGFKFAGRRNSSFQLSIGYKMQAARIDYLLEGFSDEIQYNRFSFMFGWLY